jgi:hypothetical protein
MGLLTNGLSVNCFVKITFRDFWCYRLIQKFIKIQEIIKTQRGKRQLSTGNAAALICVLKQIYLRKTK